MTFSGLIAMLAGFSTQAEMGHPFTGDDFEAFDRCIEWAREILAAPHQSESGGFPATQETKMSENTEAGAPEEEVVADDVAGEELDEGGEGDDTAEGDDE